MSSRLL
nr:unnamed protein product [Timema shepardi]